MTKSHVAIYTPFFDDDSRYWVDFDVFGTSSPQAVMRYRESKIYEHHHMSEVDLPPMTAHRRSDEVPDDAFRQLGPLADFLMSNGMFYIANVPGRRINGEFLCLHTWRDETEPDFSDTELQRMALIMRYLMAIVDTPHAAAVSLTPKVIEFANKHGLTKTEAQILGGLIDGYSPREIAMMSGRGYGTVRWHIQNILAKCGVGSQRTLLADFYSAFRAADTSLTS